MARPETVAKTELGKRLRSVRDAIGEPQRENFAMHLGVSVGALAFYERGEREPTISVLSSYQNFFGVNLNWLLTGKGAMFSQEQTIETCGSAMLDYDVLENAVSTVEIGLEGRTQPITAENKTKLIIAAYNILKKDKTNTDSIIQLVRIS